VITVEVVGRCLHQLNRKGHNCDRTSSVSERSERLVQFVTKTIKCVKFVHPSLSSFIRAGLQKRAHCVTKICCRGAQVRALTSLKLEIGKAWIPEFAWRQPSQ